MAFLLVAQSTWEEDLKRAGFFNETTQQFVVPSSIEELKDLAPARATAMSAGYDFKMPFDLLCNPGTVYTIPTGFKWSPIGAYFQFDRKQYPLSNSLLLILPRSSLGFKYGFRLVNTVAVIDADYYNNPANEGDIIIRFTVDSQLSLTKGQAFCQGLITSYGFDRLDTMNNIQRQGGMGSTD